MILDGCAGPGGWDEAARRLGLQDVVGIEYDTAACRTRAAAGHRTIQADVARFPVAKLAGRIEGQIFSPPCTTFSDAGLGAGRALLAILAEGIRDALAGRQTIAARRLQMARALRASQWRADITMPDDGKAWRRSGQVALKKKLLARRGRPQVLAREMNRAARAYGAHPTRAQRSAVIWDAVRNAALVIEPARYIAAGHPEWIALEQVPAVLPLWKIYALDLIRAGYSVWCGKVDAADYGVPQNRLRAVLVASRVRHVGAPAATHYDPRGGPALFGSPWVSMAEALGWGATARPVPTITCGGTKTGGAEPIGHRDRDALAAEQEAGRWALRIDAQCNASVRDVTAPALKFGHSSRDMQWVLRTSFGEPSGERHGSHEMDPAQRPSHAVTSKTRNWSLRMDTQSKATLPRPVTEPAPTIQFGHRSNLAGWVEDRPATTLQGDARVFPPHAGSKGEHQSADAVRITVQEAAILQSFPADYPWQGPETKRFEQIGNAVPVDLAMHLLAAATGKPIPESHQFAATG